jgi:rare lipoprotein A
MTAAQARFEDAPVDSTAGLDALRIIGSGKASYYGAGFAGRRTASGERFNPAALTAAHRTLPFGTRVKVTNPNNGRSVVVRINDRGPYHHARVIDLSHEAARQIGLVQQGHGQVELAAAS